MFCPDCGTQCDSRFCPSCGRNLQDVESRQPMEQAIPPLKEPYFYEKNGKRIDLHKIIRVYGMGWRKSGAYAYLMTELGISKEEAKSILDPVYAVHAGEKISYSEGLKASISLTAGEQREKQEAILQARRQKKEKKRALDEDGVAYCPKCMSTSVTPLKRGYSAGQALLTGNLLFGAVGANKVKCMCLKCGHKWKP